MQHNRHIKCVENPEMLVYNLTERIKTGMKDYETNAMDTGGTAALHRLRPTPAAGAGGGDYFAGI